MQRLDVLQNVGSFRGDQDHVHFFERLVDVPDSVGFNGSVLGAGICEFRKGREEAFDS